MESTDLTIRVLQDIRDEIRGLRTEQRQFREEQKTFSRDVATRFEVVEGALKDLAEQLVMLARGVKVAVEQRPRTEERLADLESRVGELEKRRPA